MFFSSSVLYAGKDIPYYIISTRTVTGHTRGQATDKDTKRGQKGRLSGGRPIRLRGSGRKGRKEKTSMHRKGKNVRA